MKIITVSGIVAAAMVASAAGAIGADQDPMLAYYGNTLMSQNQPLYINRTWFYPDHTFPQFRGSAETTAEFAKMPRVAGFEGTWAMQGNQLCLTYNRTPAPASLPPPMPGCAPFTAHKVGDVWKQTYSDGPYKGTTETYTIS